ncbi:diacylglycerol kinase, putative [Plasmodium malariae]|uniref:diacylglycerol kinase (ATP) n=1 Tax=Plasmodium malariae TaxID=5858 RepID=A0A1D3JMY0_PLAMA|nr:diacylglycerol kinase, putative [Plasmodium malariae]SBT87959.1 diacylglycerol kinase, putative [Plasmodium malariae]
MEDFAYVDKNVYINVLMLLLKKTKEYFIGIGILKLLFCVCIICISIFFAKRKNKKKRKINIYLQLNESGCTNGEDVVVLDYNKRSTTKEEAGLKERSSKLCEYVKVHEKKNHFYRLSYSSHVFDLRTINRIELCNVCNENIYAFIFFKKNIFECIMCRNKCHIECAPNCNLMSCKTSVFFKNKHKFIKVRNNLWNNKCSICNKKFSFFSLYIFIKRYIYKCIWCNKCFHVKCVNKHFSKRRIKDAKNEHKNIVCTYNNNKYLLYPYEVFIKENVLIDFLIHAYNKVTEEETKKDDILFSYNSLNNYGMDQIDNKKKIVEKREDMMMMPHKTLAKDTKELLYFDYVINPLKKLKRYKNVNCKKKNIIIPVHINFILNFFPIHLPIYQVRSSKKFFLIFVNVKSGGQTGKNLYQELLMHFNPIQIISIRNQKNVLNALNMYKEMFYLNKVILLLCGGDGTISIFVDTLIKFFSSQLVYDSKKEKKKNTHVGNTNENIFFIRGLFLNKTIKNIKEKLKHNKDMLRKKWNNKGNTQMNKDSNIFSIRESEEKTIKTDDSTMNERRTEDVLLFRDHPRAHKGEHLTISGECVGSRSAYYSPAAPLVSSTSSAHAAFSAVNYFHSDVHNNDIIDEVGRGTPNAGANMDINTDLNSDMNSDMNSGMNSGMNCGINRGINSGMNSEVISGLNSDLSIDLKNDLNNLDKWKKRNKYNYILKKLKKFKKKSTKEEDICRESTIKSFPNGNSMTDNCKSSNPLIYRKKEENNGDSYLSTKGVENERMYKNILYHDYKEKTASTCFSTKTGLNETSVSYYREGEEIFSAYINNVNGTNNCNRCYNSICDKCRVNKDDHLGNENNNKGNNHNGKENVKNASEQRKYIKKNKNKTKESLHIKEVPYANDSDNNSVYKIDNGYKIIVRKRDGETRVVGDQYNCSKKEVVCSTQTEEGKGQGLELELGQEIKLGEEVKLVKEKKGEKRKKKKLSLESCISNTPIGILPLGTGNDLSISLGWGSGYNNGLFFYLNKIKNSKNELVDIWNIKGYDLDKNIILNNSFINYFDIGIISRLALHFDNIRKKFPHFFNSRIGNKILYGEIGFRDFFFNTYKYKLNENIKIYCDGKKINIDEDLESVCLINIPHFLGGVKIWKEDELEKNYYSDVEREQQHRGEGEEEDGNEDVDVDIIDDIDTDGDIDMHDKVDKKKKAKLKLSSNKVSSLGCPKHIHDYDSFSYNDDVRAERHSRSCHPKLNKNIDNSYRAGKKGVTKRCAYKYYDKHEYALPELKKNYESIKKQEKKSEDNEESPKNDKPLDCSNIYKSYRLDFYKQKKGQQKFRKQRTDDKVIEVIGFRNMFHLVQVQIGMSKAIKLCQGSDIVVKIDKKFIESKNKMYFQYDGEPAFLNIHKLHFTHKCQCLFLSPKTPI